MEITAEIIQAAIEKVPELVVLGWIVHTFLKGTAKQEESHTEARKEYMASLNAQRAEFRQELDSNREAFRWGMKLLENKDANGRDLDPS